MRGGEGVRRRCGEYLARRGGRVRADHLGGETQAASSPYARHSVSESREGDDEINIFTMASLLALEELCPSFTRVN